MRSRTYTQAILTVIAILLVILAFRPMAHPAGVLAQTDVPRLYIEPGVNTIRSPGDTSQTEGKVIIDLRTGDVWGFPTQSPMPYPVDTAKSAPPVSSPMYLGRFDLGKMQRP